jgi:hypothetical protein
LKPFIVVNRQTRKIVAEFESREEAGAFRDGLINAQATAQSLLSIRSTLGDRNDRKREPLRGLISASAQFTLFAEGNAEDRAGLVPNSPPVWRLREWFPHADVCLFNACAELGPAPVAGARDDCSPTPTGFS